MTSLILAAALTVTSAGARVEHDEPYAVLVEVGRTGRSTTDTVEYHLMPRGTSTWKRPADRSVFCYRLGTGATQAIAETNAVAAAVLVGNSWTRTAEPTRPVVKSISRDAGDTRVTVEFDASSGNTLALEGRTSLSEGSWEPADTLRHRFFRAVQR